MTTEPDQLPAHIRPIMYALVELLLDVVYTFQGRIRVDLESMLILLCVSDASMRPFMIDPDTPRDLIAHTVRPPESIRGAISRRMIADKTGLSRETVRRRTKELAEMGLIRIDEDDLVRSEQMLDNPMLQRMLEEGHDAILRYQARLRSYGVDPSASFRQPD